MYVLMKKQNKNRSILTVNTAVISTRVTLIGDNLLVKFGYVTFDKLDHLLFYLDNTKNQKQ